MIFKDLIKNIDDNFKKVLKIEEKEINNSNDKAEKITKWPCEEDKFLFTDYKDQSLEVYISAENAKTHSIFFNSVDQIITALQEKQPILHDDPEFKELIKDYPGMKNNSKK